MKKKNNLALTIIFSFIVGGLFMLGILKWTPVLDKISEGGNNTVINNGTQVFEKSYLAASVEKIYDAVMVVNGYQGKQLASTGTAFVYRVDAKYGYLLTNQHVVKEMKDIRLINTNNEEIEAKVLGGDTYLDLAVLRIDKKYVKLVSQIGKSTTSKIGDTVFTVGTPMGNDYAGSVTAGIISGKDRMVSVSTSEYNSNDWVMNVIQIDASLNPGNSGGPLLNVNGEVIGICSMKLVDAQIEGMGFAIPVEFAQKHIKNLESGKDIDWPLLGVKMTDINESMYTNSDVEGVVVVGVVKGTGAQKAGIKEDDIITKLNGKKVKDVAHLRYELYQYEANDTITLTVIRHNKEKNIKVTLNSSKD